MKGTSTRVNSKEEVRMLLSAAVAMGHSIHGDGTTVDQFVERYGDVKQLRLHGYAAGNWSTSLEDVSHGEFLLQAAMMKFGPKPQFVKLNDDYTAIVSPDKAQVTVGCQTFDASKIKELAALLA